MSKFKQHLSNNLINESITNNESLHFLPTEQESILLTLIAKKPWTFKNIPTLHLKDVSDISSPILAII